ncbi:tape measure domain-containing protein [Ochrobactrum sp. P20RRXII]|nr:tape measure protein [Ochrobactrum sp. P20RRXII]NIH77430.1 tape measure domain-containing protein [Ochrobactrum sp. P20RRXII]
MSDFDIKLVVDNTEVNQGLKDAARAINQFTSVADKAANKLDGIAKSGERAEKSLKGMTWASGGFLSNMRDLSIVLTTATYALNTMRGATQGWVTHIVQANAEMERLTYLLSSMSKGPNPFKEAGEQLQYMRDLAKQVPFSLNAISNSYVKFKAAGLDPANGSLNSMLDAISAFGGSDEQLNRITVALTQMQGKGVISMEELRQQLGEHLPTAMQVMARSMNTTVGNLTKQISTGMVESNSALKAFFAELRMTYGGTSIQMMKTFNGQISQMKTNFTQLVTTGQNKAFFEDLKSSMQDMNRFLQGDVAKQFADQVGSGLSSALGVVKGLVSATWEWRDTIINIGAALATIGALKIFGGIANSVRDMASTFATSVRGMNSGAKEMVAGLTLFAQSLAESKDRMTGLTLAGAGVRRMFTSVLSGVLAAAPVWGAVGLALMELWGYLDLTGEKFKKAKDDAVRYGAETLEELAKLQKKNDKEITRLQRERDTVIFSMPGLSKDKVDEIYADYEKRIDEARKKNEKFAQESTEATNVRLQKEAAKSAEDEFSNRTFQRTKQYEAEVTALKAKFDQEVQIAQAAGTNIEKVEKAHFAEIDKVRDKFYDQQLADLDRTIAQTKDKLKTAAQGTEAEALLQGQVAGLIKLQGQILDEKQTKREIRLNSSTSDSKNISKVQTQIKNIRREVSGLTQDIDGTFNGFHQLIQSIEDEKFGNLTAAGDELKEQLGTLVAMTAQYDALKQVRSGYQSAVRDIDSTYRRMRKQMQEWRRESGDEAQPLTKADEIEQNIRDGQYKGLGIDAERVKAELRVTLAGLEANAKMADLVGLAYQKNAFGSDSQNAIQTTGEQIDQVNQKLTTMQGLLSGASFANLALPAGVSGLSLSGLPAYTSMKGSTGNPFLDLVAGKESGGDYNRSLDNGYWIGGEKNLSAMSLRQVRELQRMMIANPANRAKYGNGKGSSAMGRYQIVGSTLDGLMREMGLSGDELFSPEMQDRMALTLAKRRGANVSNLRDEWEGLKHVDPQQILAAYGQAFNGPTRANAELLKPISPIAAPKLDVSGAVDGITKGFDEHVKNATADLEKQLTDLRKFEVDQYLPAEQKSIFNKYKNRYTSEVEEAVRQGKGFGKFESELEGARADKSSDIAKLSAEDFQKLVAEAKRLDEEMKNVQGTQKLNRDMTRETLAAEKERIKINQKIEELNRKIKNPLAMTDSSAVQNIKTQYDEILGRIEEVYGKQSEQYKQFLSERDGALKGQHQVELLEEQVQQKKLTEEYRKTQMTKTQLANYELQQAMKAADERLAYYKSLGYSEIDATKMVEEEKARLRAQYNSSNDQVSKTFQQWSDLQGNVQDKIDGWMNSAADGLTGLITGTGDLKSAIDGMIKDVVNMSLKWAMSQMFQKGGGSVPGASGNGGAKSLLSLFSKGKATAHTGGSINPGRGMRKNVSALAFAGAPRFHGGGVIGKEGLLPSEVPLIGKKGEVVFTPGQVDALSQGIDGSKTTNVISPTINVNASGGTHEQNSDLAKQVSKEVEKSISGLVAKEISKQQRPGNMIGRRFA